MFWIVGGLIMVGLLGLFWWIGRRAALSDHNARRRFETERTRLEQQFFDAASASGKPRGLRWKGCEWNSTIELARGKGTGLLGFAGLVIRFEAIPGSDMEGLPAVGNPRNASAVFFLQHGRWHTLGQTVFNLNPDEAIAHFGYERVEG